MKRLCVDRIVGDIIVCECEDFSRTEINISDISFDIREGSIILTDGENNFLDEAEEEARRRKVIELQNKLKNKK